VLPAETCEIVDNWDVAGLRGTGSHDVLANRIVVSEQQLFSAKDFARHDGPLWRLPFFTLCAVLMAGFPLGVGRRALDELALLAVSKIRPPSRVPVAEDGDLQLAVARAEGGLRSARAFVFDALGAVWDIALRGDVPQISVRAEFLLSVQQAMWAALAAVDAAFSYAGAGALRLDHPVQRCFRDLHAAVHARIGQAVRPRPARPGAGHFLVLAHRWSGTPAKARRGGDGQLIQRVPRLDTGRLVLVSHLPT
jgi:alkylation response protein AidB-like acyl-CoA dehydrogenase